MSYAKHPHASATSVPSMPLKDGPTKKAPRIPHSDLVRLPSSQHIPSTVILCVSCLGRVAVGSLGRVAVRILGVVPSGLSPRGVASFYTLGWGSGDPRGNGLQSPPVPAPHLFPASSGAPCALTPRG